MKTGSMNTRTDTGRVKGGLHAAIPSEPAADQTEFGSAPPPEAKGLLRRSLPVAAVLALGLILGLVAGVIASGTQQASYLATSTYALIPGSSVPGQTGTAPATRMPAESGQLALLTPVIAAVVSDPASKDEAAKILGGTTDAVVQTRLVPNSPLLFSVQVTGTSAEETYAVAQAYETAMPGIAKVSSSLAGTGATLAVVTGAEMADKSQSLPKPLIILAAGLAGLLVFGAAAWAYSQRKRWAVAR